MTALVRSPLVAFTALGVALYAISRGGYQVFYAEYGVTPEEVGIDYITLLSRQALPAAVFPFCQGEVRPAVSGYLTRRREIGRFG